MSWRFFRGACYRVSVYIFLVRAIETIFLDQSRLNSYEVLRVMRSLMSSIMSEIRLETPELLARNIENCCFERC